MDLLYAVVIMTAQKTILNALKPPDRIFHCSLRW